MSTETNFSTSWLAHRFAFDAEARNPLVEKIALKSLPHGQPARILDLGAGTGNNCRYFIPRIEQAQKWVLVELNADLRKEAMDSLSKLGEERGYQVQREHNRLMWEGPKQVEIQLLDASFLQLDTILESETFDLALAGAVLDLLSKKLLVKLLDALHHRKIPLLATLNICGMKFDNATAEDMHYTKLYLQHMERPQPFGQALGSSCITFLKNWLGAQKRRFLIDSSDWIVDTAAHLMHEFILDYMANAVPELLQSEAEKMAFQDWTGSKRVLSKEEKLSLRVEHFDIFIP